MSLTYLITGSRKYKNAEAVRKVIIGSIPGTMFIFGDCSTGADRMAYGFCIAYNRPFMKYDAEWSRYGLSAGPRRNSDMVSCKPDRAFAFLEDGAGNRGTEDCIKKCENAGIPVVRINSAGVV
jgi:hypothetical protein